MRADGTPELERVVKAVDSCIFGEAEIESVDRRKEENRVDVVKERGPLCALSSESE